MKIRLMSVLALGVAASLAQFAPRALAQEAPPSDPLSGAPPTQTSYDREFPTLHYESKPVDNPVARLQKQLDAGQVKLDHAPGRGRLDALLKALGIDISSQVLLYSKTSLQTGAIDAATPRALYFNTDTYVGYVQDPVGRPGSTVLEIATMDTRLGQVLYTLDNAAPASQPVVAPRFERQTTPCMRCHDTFGMSGGGVPRFLLMSSYVDVHGRQLTHEDQILTEDNTPLKYRWGGWYVTGHTGKQVHVGNILVQRVQELVNLEQVRRGNLDTLEGLFDTKPYPTDKSDVVALLVLQHQVTIQNLITRINYEARQGLASIKQDPKTGSLAGLPEKQHKELDEWIDVLGDALTFVDFAPITDTISGNSGFDRWFQAQGPKDRQGRSLRELDLHDRLFHYPISYLIQTPAFDELPDYARHRVYDRIAAAMLNRALDPTRPPYTAADKAAALQLLRATKPDFAQYMATRKE